MRTSFHHQPEAQHPNFPPSTSRQADYLIFTPESGHRPTRLAYAPQQKAPYSITSSASARIVGGVSRLSDLAVSRLMTKSNFVGCWAGNAGVSPLSRFCPPNMRSDDKHGS